MLESLEGPSAFALATADAQLLVAEIQTVTAINAENAAYDAEWQSVAAYNQAVLAHTRRVPSLAGRNCKMSEEDCWIRYQQEKTFCERYYGTVMYGMCRDRALKRYEACRDGLDPNGLGPLDPLDPNWTND